MHFDAYNKKTDIPESLVLADEEYANIEDFKQRVIYKEVYEANEEGNVFDHWMEERIGGHGYGMAKKRERADAKAALENANVNQEEIKAEPETKQPEVAPEQIPEEKIVEN